MIKWIKNIILTKEMDEERIERTADAWDELAYASLNDTVGLNHTWLTTPTEAQAHFG